MRRPNPLPELDASQQDIDLLAGPTHQEPITIPLAEPLADNYLEILRLCAVTGKIVIWQAGVVEFRDQRTYE